jgi:SAM-dependent methyltransferase
MRAGLLAHLRPEFAAQLDRFAGDAAHVEEGVLRGPTGGWWPVVRGVPCFLIGQLRPDLSEFERKHNLPSPAGARGPERDAHQAKTTVTFSDKWSRFKNYGLEAEHQTFLRGWYCKKLGLPDETALRQFYRGKTAILEVGPGSGFNSRFMAENSPGTVIAADISEAAHTTYGNTKDLANCHVVQADVMNLPFPDNHFDFAIADGVLHHTPDTRAAVAAMYSKVRPGGQFFFYVYKKMGAARQFCDAHIREHFTRMDPEACYAACEPITELGRELSKLKAKITLTKPIPVLGIPAGEHDVQRLLYYNFVKCFWNDAFDYETNNMVNFDWYHPHNAWQHTEDEVRGWLRDLGVTEFAFHPANPNGLSVLLRKPA